ncbi:hypothetical protein BDA99DRAFT_521906 [Phascolomyces articulosus]|uniref:DH domain-containing protein n=1 Tax=Phascolomyces articulosus TaxID=60185 RepID=A0AAD5P9W5_9FUNG|nr:hypothetical protein BDA99DRAFT_521906 [Phascolomyces articulosus]
MTKELCYASNPSCDLQSNSPATSISSASISSGPHHPISTSYQAKVDLPSPLDTKSSNLSLAATSTTTTSSYSGGDKDDDTVPMLSATNVTTTATYTKAAHGLPSSSSLSLGNLQPQAKYSTLSLVNNNDNLIQQRRMHQRKAEISAATAAMMAAAKAAKKHASTYPSHPTVKSSNNIHNHKLTSDHASPSKKVAQALGRELILRVDTRTIQSVVDRTLLLDTNSYINNTKCYLSDCQHDDGKFSMILSPSVSMKIRDHDRSKPSAAMKMVEEKEKNQENSPDELTMEPNINKGAIVPAVAPAPTTLAERHLRRRQGAIQELLDTEVSYCKDLSHLVNHFFRGIAEITNIPDRFKERLFRNCTEVLSFQTQFSEALLSASRIEQNPDNHVDQRLTRIAHQFCDSAEKFNVYIDYCIYQDKATEIHKELMSNNIPYQHTLEKLNKFKRSIDEMNGRRMFEDYMIMPVQRLLKYKLILESMNKTVQTDTKEHEALMQALLVMHKVALRLNSEKSRLEARRKTKLFLNRLDSDWVNAASKRFYGVLGSCILIGTLDIRILSENTKVKRFGCALFNSYMIIAKGKRYDRYEPRHWFPLRTFDVQDLPNEQPSLPHSWLLFSETQSIEFSAMCEQEKQIWLDKLREAIKASKDEYDESRTSNTAVEELFVSSFNFSSTSINNSNIGNVITSDYPNGSSPCTSLCSYSPQVHGSSNVALDHMMGTAVSPNCSTIIRPDTPKTICSTDTTEELGGPQSGDSPTHSSTQSSNVNSPGMRSQASLSDFCDFVTNTVADFRSQRRHQQYSVRALGIDNKFEDVCTTPILTARSQVKNDRSSGIENNQWKHQRKSRVGKSASMLAFTSIKGLEDEQHGHPHSHHHLLSTNSKSIGAGPALTTATLSSSQDIFKSAVRRKASLPSRLRVSEPIINDVPLRRPPSTHSTHSTMIHSSLQNYHYQQQQLQQLPPVATNSVNMDSMIFRLSRRGSLTNNNDKPQVNESATSLQSIHHNNIKIQNPASQLPPQATPGLPRSLSAATMGLARTSSRFFGRMVEKLGTIGTPRRTRRHAANSTLQQQNISSYVPHTSTPVPINTTDLSQKLPRKTKRQLSRKPPPLIIPGSPIIHRTNSINKKSRATERHFQK